MLAKGLDAGYRKRKSGETVEGWYESSSRLVPPTTSDAHEDDEDELPDEEALTARVLAEESQRRARLASSGSNARGPPIAGGRGKMREAMPSSSSSAGEAQGGGRARGQQRVSIMLGDGAVRPVAKLTVADLKQIDPQERDRLLDLLKTMSMES